MPRYTVYIDTSWGNREYHQITVEAETASKATYEASKHFGLAVGKAGMAGKEFGMFIRLFRPVSRRVPGDTPLCYEIYSEDDNAGEIRLICKFRKDGKRWIQEK